MSFAQYVKANYDAVRHLPSKQRMKALSVMYKGENKSKGGVLSGAGFLSNALDSIGLGLDEKPKRKTKGGVLSGAGLNQLGASSSQRAPKATGGYGYVPPSVPVDIQYAPGTAPFPSLSSQTRQALGLRLNSGGQSYQGVGMVASPTMVGGANNEHGSGFLSGVLGSLGLGLPVEKKKARGRPRKQPVVAPVGLPKKRGRPSKKVQMDKGGGFLSGILGTFGL